MGKKVHIHTDEDKLVSLRVDGIETIPPNGENYQAMKKRHADEIDAFPIGFAFNKDQFQEVKKKLGCEVEDLISIGSGGVIRKKDFASFKSLFEKNNREIKEAQKSDKFLHEQFVYELANHEYGYTYDQEPTLEACGFTVDEMLDGGDRLKSIFYEAIREYLKRSEAMKMTKNKLKHVSGEIIKNAISVGGSINGAAKILGVTRDSLYKHLKKIGKETFTDLRDK